MLVNRYASLIVLKSTEPWSLLPLLALRQGVYTDPNVPPKVKSGLFEVGRPDDNSPVLVTTNFSLTYHTVASDLEKAKVDCYLMVVNTGGFAVDASVAMGVFNAGKVKKMIEKTGLEDKIKHRKLIIPLLASRIKKSLEDETGWEVIVGPRDSSQISGFLKKAA
jgi:acetyl-CoA decarbonylase/synthase complex subunit gamma